jgi:hypothetical protein
MKTFFSLLLISLLFQISILANLPQRDYIFERLEMIHAQELEDPCPRCGQTGGDNCGACSPWHDQDGNVHEESGDGNDETHPPACDENCEDPCKFREP